MAGLVPLLIPPLVNIATGIGVGLYNASQADTSAFTLSIGNKVFTTTKPFPLLELPFELREQIILEALEASKSSVGPPPPPNLLPPGHPFYDPDHPLYNHPGNPYHPLFINPLTGERNLNGYPGSAWKWVLVSREWWVVIRPKLWERTVLRGRQPYGGFVKILESTDSQAVRAFVKVLELREDAADVEQMYLALSQLPNLEQVIYRPQPMTRHLFQFGLPVIRTDPGPKSITISVPFDIVTNPSTRNHLLRLTRLDTFDLVLSGFSLPMANFLASLPHLHTLTLRMPTIAAAFLQPFEASTQPLTKFELYLSRTLQEGDIDTLRSTLHQSERLGPISTVFMGPLDGRTVLYAPTEEVALALGSQREQELARLKERDRQWERTTKLRLFGGLINLTMESTRRGEGADGQGGA